MTFEVIPSMGISTRCSYVSRYSLRHRKCGVWGYIHELFVSKPERARYERVRVLTQTCYCFPSSSPFSKEKFGGGAAKKPPNLESHLNTKDERL